MKSILFTTVLFTISTLLVAQNSTTTIQHIKIESAKQIFINLGAPYEVAYWNGQTIRIETTITLYNTYGMATLRYLADMGQYKIQLAENDTRVLDLCQNSVKKLACINGKPVVDKVSYKVYLPQTTKIDQQGAELIVSASER